MRSLVAEIFHSLSRNSALLSSANSSSCGPITTRIGASATAGRSIRRSAAAARGRDLQFVAGLQRARIGAAETGAGIDREAAEHRLARNAALDREVAEGAAARKAERQGLAVRQRHRGVERHGAAGDVGVARSAGQRDANRAAARGECRAERADFDRRRKRRVSDQNIRRRQRQPVHRAARRQTVALGAGSAAVLHRACRANR